MVLMLDSSKISFVWNGETTYSCGSSTHAECETTIQQNLSIGFFSFPILIRNVVLIGNALLQALNVTIVWNKNLTKLMGFFYNIDFGPPPEHSSATLEGDACQFVSQIKCADDSTTPHPSSIITLGFFSTQILAENLFSLFNLVVQISGVIYIKGNKYFRKGTFYTILLTLSISVIVRIAFSITAVSISAIVERNKTMFQLCTQSSLYLDYFSNFFSLAIIFCMSLNRCFCFVAKYWNEKLFEGKRVIIPISICAVIALLGAVVSIRSSDIKRIYIDRLGFIDIGDSKGLKTIVNRVFYLFPIGSVVCYVILYVYLYKRTRLAQAHTTNSNRGDQKVFIQLLITIILYSLISIVFEFITLHDWNNNTDLQMTFIAILNIFTYFPEISLPLMLLCSSTQLRKKLSNFIAPKNERASQLIIKSNTTTTTL